MGKSSKRGADETEMTEQAADGDGKKGSANEVSKKGGPAEEPVIGEMKRGDYMIHIFIEKIKDIKIADGEDTVDPMIETSCLQQKQYSSSKKGISGIGEVTFNEHIFLEQRNVEKKDAEEAKITLRLLDKCFFKDDLIGQFEFDLSYIYFMKDHMLLHQWLALSNPNSENYSQIKAYLKVSISVIATGDQQIEIKEEDGPGDDENIMMPPQLNPKFYQIILRFFQAQDLPAMDAEIMYLQKAKIDAFMMTHYKNKALKTQVLLMEDNPDKNLKEHIDWNEEFWIPAQIPIISGRLVVKLMDEDNVFDETVGSLLFDLNDLIKEHCSHDHDKDGHDKSPKAGHGHGHGGGGHGHDEEEDNHEVKSPFTWKNIYGSPLNLSNSVAKVEANNNPELGSMWKGRILMQIEVKETEKPVAKVQRVDDDIIRKAQSFTKNKEFEVIAEVGQALNLPEPKKYTIKIIIGGHHLDTDTPRIQKGNYNQFNKRFELTNKKGNSLRLPYQNIDQMGFVIIILMDENQNPVSYWKDRVSAFTLQNAPNDQKMEENNVEPEYRWITLLPDLCVNKVKHPKDAGMISFKMSVHQVYRDRTMNKEVYNNFKDYDAWSINEPKRLHAVKIRAYIYQGRDLPAADANGTSDPYLRVWDMSEDEIKTKVIEDTTNPQFYEVLEMTYFVRGVEQEWWHLENYPPIMIDVYDEDKTMFQQTNDFMGLGESQTLKKKAKPKKGEVNPDDDYMARAIINLNELNPESISILKKNEINNDDEIPPTPQWHHIRFSQNEPTCGEILVSFAISEHDYNFFNTPENVQLAKQVEFEEFDVDMNILGLRGLQSPGILPVKKAFVQFNIKSLVPPNSTAVENIRTQPTASGNNPTINTTMKFTIPLPIKSLYCPKLSCAVYDYIFKGWNQPMIGVFVLPIGELMESLKLERETELNEIIKINEALENIMDMKGISYQNNSINNGSSQDSRRYGGNKSIAYDRKTNMDQTMTDSEVDYSMASATQINKLDNSNNDVTVESEDSQDQIVSNKRRKKESYNERDDMKPLIKKNLKNSDIIKKQGAADALGASERSGIQKAFAQKFENIAKAQERRQSLLKIGQMEQKKNISYVLQGQRKQDRNNRKGSKTKKEMMQEIAMEDEYLKREEENERKRAFERMVGEGQQSSQYVIKPKYKFDERLQVDIEDLPPPDELYMGLGWDDIHAADFKDEEYQTKKHYRLYYNNELENVRQIFPKESPFNTYKLIRGQTRGVQQSMFSKLFKTLKKDDSGQDSTLQEVGSFKGIIQIESKKDKEKYHSDKKREIRKLINYIKKISTHINNQEINIILDDLKSAEKRNQLEIDLREIQCDHLQIPLALANLQSDEHMKAALLAQQKCTIRLYMIEAYELASRDIDSPSDPYLYITCNSTIVNERDNYQLDEANPKFYCHYDFEGVFPGSSPLQIDVYDYDMIFGDDLIGKTAIDLEDRYFTLEWQSLEHKPIEFRKLYHESSSLSQGVIKCWVEIIPIDDKKTKIYDISEKPEEEFEVRICVFNAKEIPMMDMEGTSDVYFRGFFDSTGDVQETDTHYRNQDGKPDFQYRLIYRIKRPSRKDYQFTLQCYDRDFIKRNDIIGATQLQLKHLIDDCSLIKKPLQLNENYFNKVMHAHIKDKFASIIDFDKEDKSKFWVDLMHTDPETGKKESHGRVKLQIDVLPVEFAEKNKVGKAREEPNHSPHLPQPEGRVQLSLNPIDMYKQMVGPEARRKIFIMLCCAIYWILFAAVVPSLMGSITSGFFCNHPPFKSICGPPSPSK